jgi:AraC-like DNA-binding protein
LQEARRRLKSGATSAEAVAYEVGYASPSQFSREYVRAFRKRYNGTTAQTLPLVLRRDNASMTLQLPVRLNTRTVIRVTPLPNASAKTVKIRSSLVRGG